MGTVRPPLPALLFVAVSSAEEDAFGWFDDSAINRWGSIFAISPTLPFDQTDYYCKTMGSPLFKRFYVFEKPIDPADLADIKLLTNQWETDYVQVSALNVERPINIDPGYVTEAKLVLATTKDRDHRIYLSGGIYAEVTVYYQHHQWCGSRWTYPDYQLTETIEILSKARERLRKLIHIA